MSDRSSGLDPGRGARTTTARGSLRGRIVLYGATVAAASLAILVAVLVRGTLVEVREYTRTIGFPDGPTAPADAEVAAARASVEQILRRADAPPPRPAQDPERPAPKEEVLPELLERLGGRLGRGLLVVDSRGAILGAWPRETAPGGGLPAVDGGGRHALEPATALSVELLPDEAFRLVRAATDGSLRDELVLLAPRGALHAADGRRLGTLLVLPGDFPAMPGSGDRRSDPAGAGPERPRRAGLLRAMGRWLGLALLAAGVVAAPLGLLLARRLARPIEALTAASRRLRAGRLGERVPVARGLGGAAELEDLAHAFNAMAEDLERAEASRRRLVADVAHELRTPLSRLRAQIEALADGVLPLDPGAIRALEGDVVGLARLVDDLQDLALADTASLRLLPTDVDLGALVARVAEAHAGAARRLGIELDLRIEREAVPDGGAVKRRIQGDPGRIEQIVGNLLANALAWARSPGGRIVVAAGPAVRHGIEGAMVDVRDDGPGIAPEDLERVFDRFVRIDPARPRGREGRGGAGLGLAIVRALARAHGGEAWAEAPPSGAAPGARLCVFLPRAARADESLTVAP